MKKQIKRLIEKRAELVLSAGSIALALAGAAIFLESQELIFIAGGLFSIPLAASALRLIRSRKILFHRDQFKWLLQHLTSRLAAGATLESAFSTAFDALHPLIGRRSALLSSLEEIRSHLSMQKPLELMMPSLCQSLSCRDADLCLQILPQIRRVGGNVTEFVRLQLESLSEVICLARDVSADTAQRRTEAIILACMPFLMVLFLSGPSGIIGQGNVGSHLHEIGMLLTYCLTMIAASLTITLAGQETYRSGKGHRHLLPACKSSFGKFLGALSGRSAKALYEWIAPGSYRAHLLQILMSSAKIDNQKPELAVNRYFAYKSMILFCSLVPFVTALLTSQPKFLLIILMLLAAVVIQDFELFKRASSGLEQDQLDYPSFLNMAESLLKAGLSLHSTLDICSRHITAYLNSYQLRQTLIHVRHQLESGQPASTALEMMAAACQLPQLQAALYLMVRHDRDGGAENLPLIRMQNNTCWALHRQTVKKRLDRQSLLLLLPMTLDLAAVMLTALLPAIQAFQNF